MSVRDLLVFWCTAVAGVTDFGVAALRLVKPSTTLTLCLLLPVVFWERVALANTSPLIASYVMPFSSIACWRFATFVTLSVKLILNVMYSTAHDGFFASSIYENDSIGILLTSIWIFLMTKKSALTGTGCLLATD